MRRVFLTLGRWIARTMPAKAGDYEVRLHANYPTKTTNLVHRVKIHVVGD